MARANKIGWELIKLFKKNFFTSNSLYKIFDRNTIKLDYSTLPNVKV